MTTNRYSKQYLENSTEYALGILKGGAIGAIFTTIMGVGYVAYQEFTKPADCSSDIAETYKGASNAAATTIGAKNIKTDITLNDGSVCTMTFDPS